MSSFEVPPTYIGIVTEGTSSVIWVQWFLQVAQVFSDPTTYPPAPIYNDPIDAQTQSFDPVWMEWLITIANILTAKGTPLRDPPVEQTIMLPQGGFNPIWTQWFIDLANIL